MWIWVAIPLGVGIVAALIAAAWHSRAESIYVGIVEAGVAMGAGHDRLQVRVYVDKTLVHELPAPSKLVGRVFIRENNTSIPLTFVRVPPYVSPKVDWPDERQERAGVPVVPVIFGFDRAPELAVHAGQLVDVYIGERSRVLDH